MTKLHRCIYCIILTFSMLFPVYASESMQTNDNILFYQENVLDNGITVVDKVINCSNVRSTNKTYEHQQIYKKDGTTIAIIAIRGTFRYDGNTVTVISKSVSQTDTYEGWNYKQNSFTSSGGTIALDAKLTKLLVLNIPITMTLSCDKNGNISYT